MKVRVSNVDKASLKRVGEINLKKLNELKAKGYTKEQCYSKFTKIFVDKNY